MVHADAALRQLPFSAQLGVVDELRRRVDQRMRQTGTEQYHEQRACLGKRPYASKEDAERARVQHNNAPRMHAYSCKRCERWHLGRSSQGAR